MLLTPFQPASRLPIPSLFPLKGREPWEGTEGPAGVG